MSSDVYSVTSDDRHTGVNVRVFGKYKKAEAFVSELLEMYLADGQGARAKSTKLGSKEQGVETWCFGEGESIKLRKQPLL